MDWLNFGSPFEQSFPAGRASVRYLLTVSGEATCGDGLGITPSI